MSTKYQVKVRKVALRSEFLTKLPKVSVKTKFPVKQAKSELSWGFLTKQPHLALRTEFWAKLPNLAVRWEFPAKLGKAGAMYPNVGCSKQRGKKSAEHRTTWYVANNIAKIRQNIVNVATLKTT